MIANKDTGTTRQQEGQKEEKGGSFGGNDGEARERQNGLKL